MQRGEYYPKCPLKVSPASQRDRKFERHKQVEFPIGPDQCSKEARQNLLAALLNRRRDLVLGLILVVAVCVVYEPAWHGGFLWDDDTYVSNNKLLTAPDGLRRIWFSLDSPSQYFPLTYTTFWIERRMWGLNTTGYHFVNILFHAANALLLWRLLKLLGVPGPWLAAALFALHPVNVESVAWIAERKNVFSLFFSLLALLAWAEFINDRASYARRAYAAALSCYALALCSKTTACTLPVAFLLMQRLQKRPIGWTRVIQITPFLLLGIAMGCLTIWWERFHQGARGDMFSMGMTERVLLASRGLWFYAAKLVWPRNLIFSYPHWNVSRTDLLAYAWVAACVVLGVLIYLFRRRTGLGLEVAALYYAATLGPLLGFIMEYTFRYTFVADHYQYAASIGPLTLGAAALTRAFHFRGKRNMLLASAASVGLLLVLGWLSFRQCEMYRDSETLWRTTLVGNPSSALAEYQLGCAYLQKGNVQEAIACYEKHLARFPYDADVHYNLGTVFLRTRQFDEAVKQYQKALEIQPDAPNYQNNLGDALLLKGDVDEAISRFEQALAIRPKFADARNNLNYVARLLATSTDPRFQNEAKNILLAEKNKIFSGGNDPEFLRVLASAFAAASRLSEAVTAAQRGRKIALNRSDALLASAFESQIQLFEFPCASTNR